MKEAALPPPSMPTEPLGAPAPPAPQAAEIIPPPPALPTTHFQPPAHSPVAAIGVPAMQPQQGALNQPQMAQAFVEPPARPGSAMATLFALFILLAIGGGAWAGYQFFEIESLRRSNFYRPVPPLPAAYTEESIRAYEKKVEFYRRENEIYYTQRRSMEKVFFIAAGTAGGLALLGSIFFYIWLYQSWKSIPSQEREVSPGKAVGMLFIPLFNLYWIFVALPGLSGNLSRSLGRRGIPTGAGKGLAITACILMMLVAPVGLLLLAIWVLMANGAKNRMLSMLPAVR